MNFALLMVIELPVGLVGAGTGYVVGVLTERGRRNEHRRRMISFTSAVFFILVGVPLAGCVWSGLR